MVRQFLPPLALALALSFALAIAVVLASPPASCPAEPLTTQGPEFADGPLQFVSQPMKQLVRIQWLDGRLSLARDWPDQFAHLTDEEIRAAKLKKMLDRGLPKEFAERRLAMQDRHDAFGGLPEPLQQAFDAVRSADPRSSGSGRRGSGDKMTISYEGLLRGTATRSVGTLSFHFSETENSCRDLRVQDTKEGRFYFQVLGDEFTIELRQKPDRTVRLTRISDDSVDSFQAKDFSTLQDEHPDAVRGWLIPLMKHMGVRPPITPVDQVIRAAVVERLKTWQGNSSSEAKQLLASLDADDFDEREQATEQLIEEYYKFEEAIKNHAAARATASLEVSERMEQILSKGPATAKESADILKFIEANRLTDSPSFLISLLDDPNNVPAVTQQLKKITDEQFGADVDAWRTWEKTAGAAP
jgi:hypothetical protein